MASTDAVLRLTEHAACILHVPKVLCASAGPREPRPLERRALRRAMARRRTRGALLAGPIAGTYRIRRWPARGGKVSIIIPTQGARGLIETAITSIRAHTAWPDYEIVCLDTIPSDAPRAQQRWKRWIAEQADRTIEIRDQSFNWSRLNNRGARQARGDYLLFLNDDIEVRDPDWLHGLIEHAQRPEVGVVGPQLLYPDGRVQHAGVFLARNAARHAFRFYPSAAPGPFGLALTQRDVISVTGACMMMRRDVFDTLGGFDEAHAVVNNDLDFNLRARASGRAVIYTPAVSLIHHEAASRAHLPDTHDSKRFARAWGDLFLTGDPFFSPHLSPDVDDYQPDAEPVRHHQVGAPLFAHAKIRKILVLKLDHIGDFVTALPAVRRLKEHFPDAELTVLAAKASLALAPLEPAIDRMIEFNVYHPRSEKGRRTVGLREREALRARLAPERFDLAIDLRRQADTRPVLAVTGARWLAGFEQAYAHPWLDIAVAFEGDIAQKWKSNHVVDSLLRLVEAVAAACATDRRLVRDPATRAEGRACLARHRPEIAAQPGPLVVVHAGAGALNKQWPAAAFADLIDLLVLQSGARVLLVGGPDEVAIARDIRRRLRRPAAVAKSRRRHPPARAARPAARRRPLRRQRQRPQAHRRRNRRADHRHPRRLGRCRRVGADGPARHHHPPRRHLQPLLPRPRRRLPPRPRLPPRHPPGRGAARVPAPAGAHAHPRRAPPGRSPGARRNMTGQARLLSNRNELAAENPGGRLRRKIQPEQGRGDQRDGAQTGEQRVDARRGARPERRAPAGHRASAPPRPEAPGGAPRRSGARRGPRESDTPGGHPLGARARQPQDGRHPVVRQDRQQRPQQPAHLRRRRDQRGHLRLRHHLLQRLRIPRRVIAEETQQPRPRPRQRIRRARPGRRTGRRRPPPSLRARRPHCPRLDLCRQGGEACADAAQPLRDQPHQRPRHAAQAGNRQHPRQEVEDPQEAVGDRRQGGGGRWGVSGHRKDCCPILTRSQAHSVS